VLEDTFWSLFAILLENLQILYVYIIVIWCFDAVQYRIEKFSEWMDDVELAIRELTEESASAPEYHQTLEKFQVVHDCLLVCWNEVFTFMDILVVYNSVQLFS